MSMACWTRSWTYLSERVDAFHQKMGQSPAPEKPTNLTIEQREVRARLIAEEACETVFALMGTEAGVAIMESVGSDVAWKRLGRGQGDLPEIADGCIDLQVVCAGTLVAAGIEDEALIDAVMDANDAKVGGGINRRGKFQKPPGWQPPDIAGELRRQGWEP